MAIGGEGARVPAYPASGREVSCLENIERGRNAVFNGIGGVNGYIRHSIASGRVDKRAA